MDELPFDFSRRLMSVVVETPQGAHRLICKGAPEEVFKRCTRFELDGEINAIDDVLIDDLREEHDTLSRDGFRVLALAYRDFEPRQTYSKDDESDLDPRGLRRLPRPAEGDRDGGDRGAPRRTASR